MHQLLLHILLIIPLELIMFYDGSMRAGMFWHQSPPFEVSPFLPDYKKKSLNPIIEAQVPF